MWKTGKKKRHETKDTAQTHTQAHTYPVPVRMSVFKERQIVFVVVVVVAVVAAVFIDAIHGLLDFGLVFGFVVFVFSLLIKYPNSVCIYFGEKFAT